MTIGIASAVGAAPKVLAHQAQWRLAAIFAATGIPATFLGTAIGQDRHRAAATLVRLPRLRRRAYVLVDTIFLD